MGLRIISKSDGFRRCGIAHTAAAKVYPDGTFSKEEVKILKAEPLLVVEEVADAKNQDGKDDKKDDKKGAKK